MFSKMFQLTERIIVDITKCMMSLEYCIHLILRPDFFWPFRDRKRFTVNIKKNEQKINETASTEL